MIIDQRHIEYEGQAVISHFKFEPPLVAASELSGHGCFIFPLNTRGDIYRQDGKKSVAEDQGILMKCGTYVNKWEGVKEGSPSEVVIIRLVPEVVETISEIKTAKLLYANYGEESSSAVIHLDELMNKFLENLFFYFDNPGLVNDELVALKIKELTLLLMNSKESNPLIDLLLTLFDAEKYQLKDIVDNHLYEQLSIGELATLANMSTPTFKRKFKAITGDSPGQYISQKRLMTAADMLEATTKNVSTIAYDCGFNDPNYFSKSFHSKYGVTPLEYRNQVR